MKAELILVILAALINHIAAVCDTTAAAYVTCKQTYSGVKDTTDVTRSTFCTATTKFKECAKGVDAACETDAQTTITADTTALKLVDCAVADCKTSDAGYTGCKTTYDGVRNKVAVTRADFCAAAKTFKTCAKDALATCETNAQTQITADTTALKFVDCAVADCVKTATEYVGCLKAYTDTKGDTRNTICAAAITFKWCAKAILSTCETEAQSEINTDTSGLTPNNCDCDTAVDGYKACKAAYDGVRNKVAVTRTDLCAAATTFQVCAKKIFVTCETNAQTIITADTAALKFVDCAVADCVKTATEYVGCLKAYTDTKGDTRNTICAAAITFKSCAKAILSTCETEAQSEINTDTSGLTPNNCEATTCDSTALAYVGCQTTFGGVNSIPGVTKTVFCAAAEAFKTCAKAVLPECEATAQTTITGEATKLKFTACGAAGISISLSLMLLTCVAVLKNYL